MQPLPLRRALAVALKRILGTAPVPLSGQKQVLEGLLECLNALAAMDHGELEAETALSSN